MTDWISTDDVKAALGVEPADATDDAWLKTVTRGVNRLVDDTRASSTCTVPGDDRTRWGAVQLATRWYGRRNAQDVAAYAELGGPPPSIDRDIEVALRLGRYYPPTVA